MKKYAYELKRDDMVRLGDVIAIVDEVKVNLFDNFCFITLDDGTVIKEAQDEEYELV